MEENPFIPIIAILSTFGTMFGLIFYYLHTRNKQRLTMLEKGVDPQMFCPKPTSNKFASLKWALLMIGVGLGFLVGSLMSDYVSDKEPIFFATILLFGGLGLLTYYFIVKKND